MDFDNLLYISKADVENIALSMDDIIRVLERAFREKGEGRTEMPPKPGIHTRPDAFIHAMPAYIPRLNAAGMKWVSGYPGNQDKDLPYISGLIILNDPETGIPIAVMDATWITAKRTGAATALAAKYLARPDSSVAGILACGVQGRSNLEALSRLFPLVKAKAFDIRPEAADRFAGEMGEELGIEVQVVGCPEDAVRGADLFVTSGPLLKHPEPSIEPGWLEPGAFASLVDLDSYWTGAAIAEADKLVTDDIEQMEYFRQLGYFRDTPRPYADLGEIVCGQKPGRESPEERILSINLGLALDDVATALSVYDEARRLGLGRTLPL